MPDQAGDRSQEATPHRREEARRKGQVAKSQDLVSAALLIAALVIMLQVGENIVSFMGELARQQLGGEPLMKIDRGDAIAQWHAVVTGLARVMFPLFGLMLVVAIVANVFQVGFMFLPEKLAFDVSRINPLKGVSRLFSIANAMRLAFGIFKILIVAGVAFWSVWSQRDQILMSTGLPVTQLAPFIASVTIWTCLKIGAALLILAILDYGFQRWKHEQDLRMTQQEVREEMKQLQGDPQIIARRRAVQRQLVLNRLSAAVPEADVVVTNPTELSIAIKYDPEEMVAPIVVAKGAGIIAQRIRRLALENNIPVIERKELARALYKEVEVNKPIPSQQYAAVAEVLRYVYELKGETPEALRAA